MSKQMELPLPDRGRLVVMTVSVTPEQKAQLEKLAAETRVSMSTYIRDGIDYVLNQYLDGVE